jgi:hypothetical protein
VRAPSGVRCRTSVRRHPLGRVVLRITDQRRYALLRVVAVRNAHLTVRLDITVWQPTNAS